MFSKSEKLESFIGQKTQFKGEISTKGTLRIDGSVEGNVYAEYLIIGEKSFIKGNATATSIVIGGTLEGNLLAKGLVDIKKRGRVVGDIITSKLTVADGGTVDGRITMHVNGAKMIEMDKEAQKPHPEQAAQPVPQPIEIKEVAPAPQPEPELGLETPESQATEPEPELGLETPEPQATEHDEEPRQEQPAPRPVHEPDSKHHQDEPPHARPNNVFKEAN